ncbi:FIP2-like protein [Mya arenaria]|uniref:FIP2-like protein n=1 Tax=Mya arenaria TaxID=6604 RepID=A0ABY7FIS5_MYAAR|nr:FIP2-like protein [Mya arenaria]
MMPKTRSTSLSDASTRSLSQSPPGNGVVSSAGAGVHRLASAAKMAGNLGSATPDPLTQRAVLESMFERRLVEGEFWYVVVAEWLEQLKKYLGVPSTRKMYHQRVHPGPIIIRRDYAHTVELVHEDAWKHMHQWYGVAEGHKPMKLVVYNYTRAPEIEHHLNNCKLMMTKSQVEDFHNVKFSKMEKVGHVEWKLRQLYNIGINIKSRVWAKPEQDGDWRPLLVRDKPIGKVLDIDSDFTRPFFALETKEAATGLWKNAPDGAKETQDQPIGVLYDHDMFEDVTTGWEMDIHEQIDHIGRDFLERLHMNFGGFMQKAKEYVEERDSVLRERERKLSSKEMHLDHVREELEERQRNLDAEIEAYTRRKNLYEEKEEQLDAEYERKNTELETEAKRRKQERMSDVYKIQDSKIKLDIGGQSFTTSLQTLARDQSSMLAAMFSGRHRLRQESDGSYFIDRDGAHFRHILNFLRDSGIKEGTLPNNEVAWGELLNEAEYYQISGLTDYLRTLLNKTVSRSNSSHSVDDVTS